MLLLSQKYSVNTNRNFLNIKKRTQALVASRTFCALELSKRLFAYHVEDTEAKNETTEGEEVGEGPRAMEAHSERRRGLRRLGTRYDNPGCSV